jgi:hypothetical protein
MPSSTSGLRAIPAHRVLDRPPEPQRLLDEVADERRVGAHELELTRQPEQRPDRVGDQVHRRDVPRDEQQDHERQHLLLVEPVPLLFGLDEEADQVLTGRPALGRDLVAQVGGELAVPPQPERDPGGEHVLRPSADHRAVGLGSPSISQMTVTGSGYANASTSSIARSGACSPRAAAAESAAFGEERSWRLGERRAWPSQLRRTLRAGSSESDTQSRFRGASQHSETL